MATAANNQGHCNWLCPGCSQGGDVLRIWFTSCQGGKKGAPTHQSGWTRASSAQAGPVASHVVAFPWKGVSWGSFHLGSVQIEYPCSFSLPTPIMSSHSCLRSIRKEPGDWPDGKLVTYSATITKGTAGLTVRTNRNPDALSSPLVPHSVSGFHTVADTQSLPYSTQRLEWDTPVQTKPTQVERTMLGTHRKDCRAPERGIISSSGIQERFLPKLSIWTLCWVFKVWGWVESAKKRVFGSYSLGIETKILSWKEKGDP